MSISTTLSAAGDDRSRLSAKGFLLCVAAVHIFVLIISIVVAPDLQRPGLLVSAGLLILAIALMAREMVAYATSKGIASDDVAKLANFATDLYWEADLDGKILFAGGRMLSILSKDSDDLVGKHYLDIVQLDNNETFKMLTALQSQQPYSDIQSTFHDVAGRRYYVSLSATPKFGSDEKITGYIGVGTNITERVRNQRQLRHMAEHDMLTGIANRYAFTGRLTKDLKTRTGGETLALLAIDLDGFKNINDTYGHQAGDALLKMVAKRLTTKTRETDWAARMGGDEFVVISRFLSNPMDACLVADRLTDVLSRPYRIGGINLAVKASIGVACTSETCANIQQLMKRADLALYRAKSDGKGCYRLYEDEGLQPAVEI
ncbi:MAG: sensor domain-containing diguanylate cyclase [Henriciella sp.]|nr:sensor domain-containing diguanylate cyclase [Henriciella sp.]